MRTKKDFKIVIVEDDLYYNKALTKYVGTICNPKVYPGINFDIQSYFTAHDCIENLEPDVDLMLLDFYLINDEEYDIIYGDEVVEVVNKYCPNCKIIMVSEQGSTHLTAQMLRNGIYDYIDKNTNSKNRIGSVIQKLVKDAAA
ncbi:response regulator [Parvicella tangerina]|uniref:Response regulator n=1 Tax=Parvicella tangerina TaxID=2829795 RepID=A0A916JJQ6_9FLAO|nr:hypothetical protein [Parvicella tangerina]CAG5076394.1 hypothetical protein CRYO30217_00096 [Parvicella tangerina]